MIQIFSRAFLAKLHERKVNHCIAGSFDSDKASRDDYELLQAPAAAHQYYGHWS